MPDPEADSFSSSTKRIALAQHSAHIKLIHTLDFWLSAHFSNCVPTSLTRYIYVYILYSYTIRSIFLLLAHATHSAGSNGNRRVHAALLAPIFGVVRRQHTVAEKSYENYLIATNDKEISDARTWNREIFSNILFFFVRLFGAQHREWTKMKKKKIRKEM